MQPCLSESACIVSIVTLPGRAEDKEEIAVWDGQKVSASKREREREMSTIETLDAREREREKCLPLKH